MKFYTTVKQ